MDIKKILSLTDHTALSQCATEEDIARLIDEAEEFGCASVCIPPSQVAFGAKYRKTAKICTVIGFPNGYSTTATKVFECADAIANGADEIDTVINVGYLKSARYDEILDELKQLKATCGDKILKVIIETCLLTDDEKVKMCEIVTRSGAEDRKSVV